MADRCITCYRFHLIHGTGRRAADQRPFDAAMLKPEHYFQMKHLFSVTLKTIVPRFNDACMYRTDSNFMYFIPFDTVEIHHARQQTAAITFAPESFPLAERLLKANRLEPGVPFRTHQALLGDLAFKHVQLRTGSRQ